MFKLLHVCQNALFRGYAVFRAARARAGSNTIKIIEHSRGLRRDKTNALKLNKHAYLVKFLQITNQVILIKF